MPVLNVQPNESIFNAVREQMSEEFRRRIPQATKDNIAQIGLTLTSNEFEVLMNEWQRALVNRIGMVIFHNYLLKNPLQKYIYGNMEFGDAIEEIATDIVSGRDMDWGKEGESIDPFVKFSPQAKAEYHRVNSPIQYMTTIEKYRIRRAFTTPGGLSSLITQFVGQLMSSANYDTWTLTKTTMAYYINDSKASAGLPLLPTQKIVSEDVTDEASAKKFLLQVKNAVSAMKFPNNAFNPQQIHKTLDNRNLTLFIRADIMNTIGVEAMASAFNIEQLNMPVSIESMDNFGTDPEGRDTDDVLAVLAEDWWLLITQQFEEMSNIYNPRGLYWNYFLTRAMSFGCSYFKDCVIFRKNWN